MEHSEQALVERAREGDREAFRSLVDAHARPLYRVCFRVTGDAALAEDAVQEAFLKIWRKLPGFDGRAKFSTWIHRIAANAAVDQMRRYGKIGAAGTEDEPYRDLVSPEPDPERVAHSRGIGEATDAALATLSEMERAAFTLRHHEGVPIAEISEVLGIAEGACRQAVFRAVRKLREALAPYALSPGSGTRGCE